MSRTYDAVGRERQPDVPTDERSAVEAAVRDADDRERLAVDVNRRADGVGIGAEPLRPELVADHRDGNRRTLAILAGFEAASSLEADAHRAKVIAADECRGQPVVVHVDAAVLFARRDAAARRDDVGEARAIGEPSI